MAGEPQAIVGVPLAEAILDNVLIEEKAAAVQLILNDTVLDQLVDVLERIQQQIGLLTEVNLAYGERL